MRYSFKRTVWKGLKSALVFAGSAALTSIPQLGLPVWAAYVIAGAVTGGMNYLKHAAVSE